MKALALLAVFAASVSFSIADAETVNMYVQRMPQHWQNQFGDILSDATKYWEAKAPGLKFSTVSHAEQADFVVEWASQYGEGKLGYYSTDTVNQYGKPKLTISLGYFKDKKWNLVSSEYALEITKHELGHAIGLPHSTDPNDIMYPTIENYESWQQSRQDGHLTATHTLKDPPAKKASSVDWQTKSQQYQKMSSNKIDSLDSKIAKAQGLASSEYSNLGSKAEMEKAQTAFWWAKKYLSMAEKKHEEAGSHVIQANYQESFKKFKSSFDYAKKTEQKIAEITKHHKKAYEMEYGKNSTRAN